ncbi:TPA: hypothetical protein DIV55_06260 [Patescibacteria group bacterium]|uniref:Peptidase A2 domain-containing protein n=1 Tax=Candidatus Gottesmanbacteria bacterium GW2011_GWA1_43_11 TaxID=1618436 RepID=A0A0G1CIN5_9BACT|nr:MAG: hypothetical protein UV59_C0008G0042 [Candidatus Gottesmanbacteria bacterium GW2011_GWA1_43_11]HCS79310.1 hypothetical protein [Patescibacteria group bacterium]
MPVTFPFKKEKSAIFGVIQRPIAEVLFQHTEKDLWQPITMLVDTGADYTLLPKFLASVLGVKLVKEVRVIVTKGVGGQSRVFLLKKAVRVKIGDFTRQIPVGFLDNNFIPPLLGRQAFLETFKVTFDRFTVTFE